MQLAVLDHNFHTSRKSYTNKSGEPAFHRKYRKASKKWDVTPTMETKEYLYIPTLMDDILTCRKESSFSMKHKESLPAEHPAYIQMTIGHKQPPSTVDILDNRNLQDLLDLCINT